MAYQSVFKRYEIKFLLSREQRDVIATAIAPYMNPDRYGKTVICNIYYDTPNYRMIRKSLEKPVYKEKLRLRSYGPAVGDGPVFVELKKKYGGIVYKRRLLLPEQAAKDWLSGTVSREDTQIAREITYVRDYYADLSPRMYVSYCREAYFGKEDKNLRITFDTDIACRQEELSLSAAPGGTMVLEPDRVLMEVKTPGALPLWLVNTLSANGIYKTAFSKYGTAYMKMLKGDLKNGNLVSGDF